MKITAFNPLIIAKDPEKTVKLFEELGFERKHNKTGIHDGTVSAFDLKHPDGYRIDIVKAPVPQDITTIRISVRDFDEAYKFLLEKGFKDINNGQITDTGTSKATMLAAPSGFLFSLSQHIREEDKQ